MHIGTTKLVCELAEQLISASQILAILEADEQSRDLLTQVKATLTPTRQATQQALILLELTSARTRHDLGRRAC